MEQITKISDDLAALYAEGNRRQWALFTTGFDFGVQEINEKLDAYRKDKNNFKIVSEYKNRDLDPIEQRGADLLFKEFQWNHLSERASRLKKEINELQIQLVDLQNKHRIQIGGIDYTSSQIAEILNKDPNQERRREAFLSRTQINRKLIDGGFLKLLDLRREYALACGRKDFASLKLETDELNSEMFNSFVEECSSRISVLKEKESQIAQESLNENWIEPWDFSYIKNLFCSFNSQPVDLVNFLEPLKSVFRSFGFDLDGLNITFDIFPRKNKSEWGYNFIIEPGVESRVLTNAGGQFYDYWILLHEAAHGVHYLGLDKNKKLINRGVSGMVSEGFANFFGNLAYSKEFLSEIFGQGFNEAYIAFKKLSSVSDLQAFELIQQTIFDQRLYLSEVSTMNGVEELVWQTRRELLGKEPYADEPVWGHLIHHTSVPIYLHNYFLGDVMCEKMKEVFQRRSGQHWAEDPKGFGGFWKDEVLKPSGRYPFPELFERVCGEKISIGSYLDKCLKYEE
ncbi:MAG TPA: hypothetical protein DCL41_08760 [Bdellovibrionales bacterium]|nr:hypothetical protein [Pseudobdellovibrionaceae bacterium]HAG91949.1 hypothetical protein [Bdellovibrionales bacterium]|tara:strand:- start:782 stop:2317 length:1536 start_codon:yes stop_codon:yes gene_type:complete